ncbi:MAG: M23 family metallopeptidase [Gammaproteobacteria bacterium]|nr:M23 family metallopeptidase [Gammaproteobacteria bacterium]
MSHILITNRTGKTTRLHIGVVQRLMIFAVFSALLSAVFYYGMQHGSQEAEPDVMVMVMQKELNNYQKSLIEIQRNSEENMNALAVRLGEVKSHVIRLDALGQRLIEKAKLEKGEFDFENEPAQGGPEKKGGERGETMSVPDFLVTLDELSKRMDHSSLQLSVLESMIMNRELHDEVYPAGRPIKRGWISSYFGYRTDPFNGRRARHDGIDLAGKQGSEVIAVASGVVTWAGKRYGYGNLVEINHGNGYVTRYGHNDLVEVKIGDAVKKGETIARMGSTGRSTGPHVHFEVHKNGKVVDPMRYVRASR